MSREIKFRAWDTETKEMSYDFLNKNWLKVCIGSPYVELMQYTGLKDKNGKEIYEGDVVKVKIRGGYSDHYCDIEYKKVVMYDNLLAQWRPFDRCRMWRDEGKSELSAVEVIGNSFEHPHLLGEKGETNGN